MAIATDEPIISMIKSGQDVRLIGAEDAQIKILCFHGGGGVGGAPDMMDNFAGVLTKDDDVRLAAARYRVLNTSPDATLEDMFEDARDALAWAKSTLKRDGLWVMGASFGGLLALDAVLKHTEGVAGLILLNPVTHTGSGGFANRVVDPDMHAGKSPLELYKDHPILSQLRCLVVHGRDDDVVPIEASREFAALWPKDRVKMIEVINATHGFFNRSPRDAEAATHIKRFLAINVDQLPSNKAQTLPKKVRLLCCVGGQKAGTSWLYGQITKSPQVHASAVKERHYFDVLRMNEGRSFVDPKIDSLKELTAQLQTGLAPSNTKLLRKINLLADQLSPYAAAAGDHAAYIEALTKNCGDAQVVCDFTPSYCGLNSEQIGEIAALGDVRFVYVLRDPVARMWSQIRMMFTSSGAEDIAEKCVSHGHELCDTGKMPQIFRADYVSTLAALDQGARNVEVVFHERLFEQATFDRLAAFIGIDPVQIDGTKKVNEGQSVPLPAVLEQKMLHALAPQYKAIMSRFKGDVPTVWHDRFNRYKALPAKENTLLADRSPDNSTMLKKLKQKIATPTRITKIVFLHIPKTAGQSIVQELRRVCGSRNMSPVRTHTHAEKDTQFPTGYSVYAGHLDWIDLDQLDDDRFSFSVLRNPRERVASFYFYLKREAANLSAQQLLLKENTGKKNILTMSVDDYFFGGDRSWQMFVRDHYDNFYTTYFATRCIRGWQQVKDLAPKELIEQATTGANEISGIYGMGELVRLESDLSRVLDARVNLKATRINTGPPPVSGRRWDDLMALFERPESLLRIEEFVLKDEMFLRRIGLEAELV